MQSREIKRHNDAASEASSQKSGADPLVNLGQKRHDESSSAKLPQDIEMIPSEVGKQNKVEKKSTTFEQRGRQALGVATMAFLALARGAEARLEPPGSALQRKDHDNTTGLTHAFNQTEFNNLSHPTALEFNPYTYKVTPELLDHLRNVGVPDPEQFTRNVQQGRYDNEASLELQEQEKPLSSNEKKIASLQALMEKAKTDPAVMGRARKLLAENRTSSEQESSEARRKLEIENRYCLDVSPSILISNGVFPTTDPAPGYEYQATLEPFVANNCPLTVTDTQLTIGHHPKCPTGTQLIRGGQNYDVPGPFPISRGQTQEQTRKEVLTSACAVLENGQIVEVHPPSIVDISLQANAHDDEGFERFSETFNWDVTP